jgi:hypothetical protein
MKIHGFDVTACIEGAVATSVLTKKTFVFRDVESAVRRHAGKLVDAHVAAHNKKSDTKRCVTAGEVVMRVADGLLKQWKAHDIVKKGAKRTEWVPTP